MDANKGRVEARDPAMLDLLPRTLTSSLVKAPNSDAWSTIQQPILDKYAVK